MEAAPKNPNLNPQTVNLDKVTPATHHTQLPHLFVI